SDLNGKGGANVSLEPRPRHRYFVSSGGQLRDGVVAGIGRLRRIDDAGFHIAGLDCRSGYHRAGRIGNGSRNRAAIALSEGRAKRRNQEENEPPHICPQFEKKSKPWGEVYKVYRGAVKWGGGNLKRPKCSRPLNQLNAVARRINRDADDNAGVSERTRIAGHRASGGLDRGDGRRHVLHVEDD